MSVNSTEALSFYLKGRGQKGGMKEKNKTENNPILEITNTNYVRNEESRANPRTLET